MPTATFNVVQFFSDGTHEYVRRAVGPEEALKAVAHYVNCVGARIGTTVRVIVTDEDDFCNFDWRRGEGVVFPPGQEAPQS